MITDEIRRTAYSIENMAGHGKDHLGVTEIERESVNGRLYIYYQDDEGGYWYKTDICPELEKARRECLKKARRWRI